MKPDARTRYNFSWWTRVRLWFKPPLLSMDFESGDYTSIITYKVLNGKVYVIDEERLPPTFANGRRMGLDHGDTKA